MIRRNLFKPTWALTALCALTFGPGWAGASLINNSFETGDLTGYSTSGNNSVQTAASSGVTPTDGSDEALSQSDGTGTTTDPGSLETFFGLAPGTLDALAAPSPFGATEGSGFEQTFLSSAGTLTFDADFATNEFPASNNPFNDYAFYTVDGVATKIADVDTGVFSGGATSDFTSSTGYQAVSVSLGAGTHTIGFGVVDVFDTGGDSGLFVDDILAPDTGNQGGGSQPSGVPEPVNAAMALFFCVLCAAGGWRRAGLRRPSAG
jgi:hypothetical protein